MHTKAVILLIGLLTLAGSLHAQPQPQKGQAAGSQSGKTGGGGGIFVPFKVIGQDTLPVCTIIPPGTVFQEVDSAMLAKQKAWRLYRYNVSKAMRYAIILQDTLASMQKRIAALERKKDQKRFIRDEEDKLKATFEKQLKDLTKTQGKLLVKLIARQTGKTTYQLIKQYKNGFTARCWQGFANVYGVSLDQEYVTAQEPDLEAALKELGLK